MFVDIRQNKWLFKGAQAGPDKKLLVSCYVVQNDM